MVLSAWFWRSSWMIFNPNFSNPKPETHEKTGWVPLFPRFPPRCPKRLAPEVEPWPIHPMPSHPHPPCWPTQPNQGADALPSARRADGTTDQRTGRGKRSLGTSHLGGWMGSHWLGCNVGKTIYLWVIVGTSPKDFPGTYIIPFQYWAIFLSLQINGGDPYQLLTIPGSPSSKQGFFFFFSVEKNYGRIPPVLALMGCFTRNFGDREGSTHQLRETVGASRFVVKIDPLFTKVF